MKSKRIAESELILNDDGSVYHLNLKNDDIADTVILVGDPYRVPLVSKYFDKIDIQKQHREFFTHTGFYQGKRITVISTGIGTDNIDIVMNELDAAINIDVEKRQPKRTKRILDIIRIGTSGGLQKTIPVGTLVAATYGLGLDGLIYYYNYHFDGDEIKIMERINDHLNWNDKLSKPYIVKGSTKLINRIGFDMNKGITATATGFFGPQGRSINLKLNMDDINEQLSSFEFEDLKIINFEMETSALYGLGRLLGHECCTICAIISNRPTGKFSPDPKTEIDKLIVTVLGRLV